jgi:formate hydrogenlyase regulatory protein HycA
MTIPDKLPIIRQEEYHTHHLGRCGDGRLFWGYETFSFTKPLAEIQGDDWQKYRKEYAVLQTFDNDGTYLTTKFFFAGFTIDTYGQSLFDKVEDMVSELGEVVYQDIEIRLFQTVIDGITFGLIVNEENEMITLQPSSTISFEKPWDGEYYT